MMSAHGLTWGSVRPPCCLGTAGREGEIERAATAKAKRHVSNWRRCYWQNAQAQAGSMGLGDGWECVLQGTGYVPFIMVPTATGCDS